MTKYNHLSLFKSCYTLCIDTYKITKNFNREYKYTIGERMKDTTHQILDKIIEINSKKNCEKVSLLCELEALIERLIIYFRISCDLKLISPAYLGKMAEQFENIGIQIAGWKKWAENNKSA